MEGATGERRPLLVLTRRRRRKRTEPRTRSLIVASVLVGTAALVAVVGWSTRRDLVDDLATGLESLTSCGSCKTLLVPLKAIAHFGDASFLSTLVTVCVGLGIQDPVVCKGALGAQAPILAHSLRGMSIGGPTGTLFCAKTFGLCEYPKVRDWGEALPIRNISRAPPPQTRKAGKKKPIRVAHLSDLHIDREYLPGADATCGRNLCCRADQPGASPDKVHQPAGPYGNHNCDSPVSLYISMLRYLVADADGLSFAIHTGDMVDHAVWNSIRSDVEDGVEQGHSQFESHLSVPLYGVIGNHDVAPTNSFPRNTTVTAWSSQWDLELFAEVWEPWIGKSGARSVRQHSGCYSVVHPGTRLKVISLNTNLWYKANFWLYDSDSFQPDPNGILQWLVRELQDAEDRGLYAWVIGHLSPGKSDCLREPSRYFNEIIRRYNDTISALFFGHTHRSEFEIVYRDARAPSADSAVNIIYIGPALTPESGNPAFRIYDIDPDDYRVLDLHEIFTNMSDPTFQHEPVWRPLYSARDVYGPLVTDPPLVEGAPLDGRFWHRVTEAFEERFDEFEKFVWRLTRGGAVKPCFSGACKAGWIRTLRSSESEFNGARSSAGLNIDAVGEDRMQEGEEEGKVGCGDVKASLSHHARLHGGFSLNSTLIRSRLRAELRSAHGRSWDRRWRW